MAKSSKKWIFGVGFLVVILISIFFAHTIFDQAVKKTVSIAINSINAKKELTLSIDKVYLSLSKGSISLKGINFVPDSLYYEKFKNGDLKKRMLSSIHISEIELTGLNLKTLLTEGRIDSTNISVKDLITTIYLREHEQETATDTKKPSSGALDSLKLKGLKSIKIGSIQVKKYQINVLNAEKKDTISSVLGDYMELDGIGLDKRSDDSQIFDLQTEKLVISFKNQRLKLAKSDFEINLGALEFRNADQTLTLQDFSYLPIKSLKEISYQRKYSDNLTDVQIKSLTVYGLNINSYKENHLASVKKILIDGMQLNLFKNKQKPDDIHKRPLLPHQILKHLKIPIHIGEIEIKNSLLNYKEIQPKHATDVLAINLTHLNVSVNFVTSIKDSLSSGKPLTIVMDTKLLDKPKTHLTITMPYNHHDDAFHFRGTIGAADLKIFNPVLIPAIHVGIESGHLESLEFNVNATPYHSKGELTMKYTDLHIDIPEKHKSVEHALSFLASSAVHKHNPKKNEKLRVSEIQYDRIAYKGLGGYMVKSLLNGVENTFIPFGKHSDKKMTEKKTEKEAKREKKKEERKKRKEQKN